MIGLLLAAGIALAEDPCEADGMPSGPVVAPLADGGLASPRRACARSELGVAGGGRLTIERADFYGYVTGALQVDGSVAVRRDLEVWASVEALRFDLGVASLTATSLGLGNTTVGATWAPTRRRGGLAAGVQAKLVLPTASGLYGHARPFGAEVGVVGQWRPHRLAALHGAFAAHLIAAAGGPPLPAGGLTVNLGVEVRPHPVFAFVLDLDGSFLRTDPLDWWAVAAALRFTDTKRFGFELGARLPVAGADRTLASVLLRGSVRFGPLGATPPPRILPAVAPSAGP